MSTWHSMSHFRRLSCVGLAAAVCFTRGALAEPNPEQTVPAAKAAEPYAEPYTVSESQSAYSSDPGDGIGALRDSWLQDAPTTSGTSVTATATGLATVSLPTGGGAISPQSISLPSGSGALGGMGESFSAQLTTGVGTFGVPFALPSARGAVQPSLSLAYSSAGGFGVAGLGWSLGAAAISRQTDRGLPRYQDRDTWYPNQDRFTFAGAELVPICTVVGPNCSGAQPGEVMPAWADGWQYFRSHIEGSYYRFFWSPDHRSWRVQAKDGTNLEFGVPRDGSNYEGGLESNPDNPAEIFRWHVVRQYDPHGDVGSNPFPLPVNVVVYRHLRDGDVVYLSDIYDTPPATNAALAPLTQYAHHTRLRYELRPDPMVSFRSGWRTETRLRVVGVDVTSKPFAGSVTSPRELLRRYHLEYDSFLHTSLLAGLQLEGRCAGPILEQTDSTLPTSNCPRMPQITFEYTRVSGNTQTLTDSLGLEFEPFATKLRTLENSPPHSLSEGLTDLMDIDADGLPDVVVTAPGLYNGNHAAFLNGASTDGTSQSLGFKARRSVGVVGIDGVDAGVLALDSPNVAVLDLDGDGFLNLVHMPKKKAYSVFEFDKSSFSWVGRRISTASGQDVKIDFTQDARNTQVMDVNGDGLVDVVYSSATEMQTFFALGRFPGGEGQFGSAEWAAGNTATISNEPVTACVPWSATAARFSEADIKVAEMNGDGLPDIVRIRSGQIFYWPGRGNGTWGTGDRGDCKAGEFGQDRHVEMALAPRFGTTSGGPLLLNDINGDGLADLVEVRANAVDVYLNDNGVGWTTRVTLDDVPFLPGTAGGRVRLSDIDGSGTPDILWGEAYNYRFIDLTGGVTPYVLSAVHNGLGRTTELKYASSTELRLADEHVGNSWSSVAPSVMQVVTSSTVRDNLELIGRSAGRYETRYHYRDPVYDGHTRQFRGFRSADVRMIGDGNSPTVVERSTFLLGECKQGHGVHPALSCERIAPWKSNPREGLKGLPALVESFDDNGVFLSTKHTSYTIRQLYAGLDGRDVTVVFPDQQNTFLYDTTDFDFIEPEHGLLLPEATFELEPGTAVEEIREVFPRASSGTAHLRSATLQDEFGNVVESQHEGCVSGCPGPVDETITVHSEFSLPPGDESGWTWREVHSYATGSVHVERRGEVQTLYDEFGNALETHALLSGTVPLLRAHSGTGVTAPDPVGASGGVSEPVWITLSTTTRDGFGTAVAQRGSNNRCGQLTLDPQYASLVVSETAFAGPVNIGTGCGERAFTTTATYDRGFEHLLSSTDSTGQPAAFSYDGFGQLLTSTFADPDSPGNLAPLPTSVIEYHYTHDASTQPYSHIIRRVQDGSETSANSYLETTTVLDGMGRTLFSFQPADLEDDGAAFIVSGGDTYNAKGGAYRTCEAFYDEGPVEVFDLSQGPPTACVTKEFDAFGRLVRFYNQLNEQEAEVQYHALSVDEYDAEDIRSGGAHYGTYSTRVSDGHGRSVESIQRVEVNSVVEEHKMLSEFLPTGEVSRIVQRRTGSADVTRWMRYDSLGRLVLNVEPNTSPDFDPDVDVDASNMRAWRYAYNDAGDVVGTSDARGCGTNYHFDAGGRLIAADYSPCQDTQQAYSAPNLTTGAGTESFYRYDFADPETEAIEDAGGDPFELEAAFLYGRLASASDRGRKVVSRYDALGRSTGTAQKVAKPGPTESSLVDRYAARWYVKEATFDTLDRPVTMTTGATLPELLGVDGSSELRFQYNDSGALRFVDSSYGTILEDITRTATGLVTDAVFGDAASTRRSFTYDGLNRLNTVQTYRAVPGIWSTPPSGYTSPTSGGTGQLSLEDYEFSYDRMGNILSIEDHRIPEEWPAFAKPVTRSYEYDDLYRLTHSDNTFHGGSTWQSPFEAENSDTEQEPKPSPHVSFSGRSQTQAFVYDFLGNITHSADDANGFYDRSLGSVAHGDSLSGPNQLTSADNRATGSARQGDLDVQYDETGNITAMITRRDGTCLPAGTSCWQRFQYEWDEQGQLARAVRWDLLTTANERTQHGDLAQPPPARTADAELRHIYDSGGGRTVKTAVKPDASQSHAVYISSTLELRQTTYDPDPEVEDYDLTPTTASVRFGAAGVSARVIYSEEDLPTLTSGAQHLFLQFSDHIQATAFTLDHETGELVQFTTYTAYGSTESDYRPGRWAEFREPYRFGGKEEDIEVGLLYFGARYLVPSLNQWLSPDAATIHGLAGHPNPYSYGGGRPTAGVDPDGNFFDLAAAAIGAAIASAINATTNAIVQFATTGQVNWGLDGVLGAAISGGVGGAVGGGLGASLGAALGKAGGGALAGALGGASGGATGTARGGGGVEDILKSSLLGALGGAAGGAVGGATKDAGWFASATLSTAASTATSLTAQAGFGGGISGEDIGIAIGVGLASGWASGGLTKTVNSGDSTRKEVSRRTRGTSESGRLSPNRDSSSSSGAKNSRATKLYVGEVPVTIHGGSNDQRLRVAVSLQKILLGTSRGAEILSTLESRTTFWSNEVEPLNVYVIPGEGSQAGISDNWIQYDPMDLSTSYIAKGESWQQFTLDRILAHELGHVAGARDDGPGSMANIRQNENPIMRQLGDPSHLERIKYYTPSVR